MPFQARGGRAGSKQADTKSIASKSPSKTDIFKTSQKEDPDKHDNVPAGQILAWIGTHINKVPY